AWKRWPGADSATPRHGQPPSDDPRLTYAGPFRNVRPGAIYVGDASCGSAGCHDNKIESYHNHPMGRSILPVPPRDEPPADRAHNNPFLALASQFRVEREGNTVRHRRAAFDDAGRPIYDTALDVAYAIGSGIQGHSYLTVRDGYVFQTPISWYAEK